MDSTTVLASNFYDVNLLSIIGAAIAIFTLIFSWFKFKAQKEYNKKTLEIAEDAKEIAVVANEINEAALKQSWEESKDKKREREEEKEKERKACIPLLVSLAIKSGQEIDLRIQPTNNECTITDWIFTSEDATLRSKIKRENLLKPPNERVSCNLTVNDGTNRNDAIYELKVFYKDKLGNKYSALVTNQENRPEAIYIPE